jgi:hypothetical protein
MLAYIVHVDAKVAHEAVLVSVGSDSDVLDDALVR